MHCVPHQLPAATSFTSLAYTSSPYLVLHHCYLIGRILPHGHDTLAEHVIRRVCRLEVRDTTQVSVHLPELLDGRAHRHSSQLLVVAYLCVRVCVLLMCVCVTDVCVCVYMCVC